MEGKSFMEIHLEMGGKSADAHGSGYWLDKHAFQPMVIQVTKVDK